MSLLRRILRKRFHFGPPDLSGQSVAIIGPAACAESDISHLDLNEFDHIVRINRSIETPVVYRGKPLWRHDIYIRNQLPNEPGSLAGFFNDENIRRCETEKIILTIFRWRYLLRSIPKILSIWSIGPRLDIYFIGPRFCQRLTQLLGGARPTTGFVALAYLMERECSLLNISGFTFFQTGYINGYNDEFLSDQAARERLERFEQLEKTWVHKPNRERDAFRGLLDQNNTHKTRVVLGRGVSQAVFGSEQ